MLNQESMKELTLGEIAERIFAEQQDAGHMVSRKFPAAYPYLDAMLDLKDFDSTYGADRAQTIVLYFLTNAGSMRGPVIKEAKAELKSRLRANGYKI